MSNQRGPLGDGHGQIRVEAQATPAPKLPDGPHADLAQRYHFRHSLSRVDMSALIQDMWAALASAPSRAPEGDADRFMSLLSVAKHALNGWGCFAKRDVEHREIARLHGLMDALVASPGAAQEPLTLKAISDYLFAQADRLGEGHPKATADIVAAIVHSLGMLLECAATCTHGKEPSP